MARLIYWRLIRRCFVAACHCQRFPHSSARLLEVGVGVDGCWRGGGCCLWPTCWLLKLAWVCGTDLRFLKHRPSGLWSHHLTPYLMLISHYRSIPLPSSQLIPTKRDAVTLASTYPSACMMRLYHPGHSLYPSLPFIQWLQSYNNIIALLSIQLSVHILHSVRSALS